MLNHSAEKYIFANRIDEFVGSINVVYRFTALFFKESFKRPFHLSELINQCFEVGLKSLP